MKKLILFIGLSLIFSNIAHAQWFEPKAPNYESIKQNISNQNSNFYYPALLDRYNLGDETLTIEEKRHLYYGNVFQPSYAPSDTSSYNSELMAALSKQSLTDNDYVNILKYSKALLAKDPFNLRALNAELLVYAQKDDVDAYKKNVQKRKTILDAVVSSGDGISKETAFHVIKISHEFDLLPLMGYKFGGKDKIDKIQMISTLSLSDNKYGMEEIYFNITPVFGYISSRGGGKM